MPLDNNSVVSAITYLAGGKQHIYAFVNGDNHLYVNYWDGNHWHWADQGGVPGGFEGSLKGLHTPSAITYQEGNQERIYVFIVGGEDGVNSNIRLYVNYWDGNTWHWADQGTPSKTVLNKIPSTITYPTYPKGDKNLIYVFCSGSDNNLHVNYWDGIHWQWADQNRPAVNTSPINVNEKAAISYLEGGKQRIYAFVIIGDKLFVNYWDGNTWQWADQGRPFPQVSDYGLTTYSAITYLDKGTRFIDVFVIGTDGNLHRNFWDGSKWDWHFHSAPTKSNVYEMIGVVDYYDGTIYRKYVFVTGYQTYLDKHLYVNYLDESGWHWADQGKPAALGKEMLTSGSVITYMEGGKQRIYVFVTATNGHLYVNYWDGSTWNWADQGNP